MKKILIVDDQPNIRKMIRFSLQPNSNFELDEAQDADEAYKQLIANRPDALILDVMMPGSMNGFQLCERIKSDPKLAGIHVVLLTACAQVSDQQLGHLVGCNAFFIKPFSPVALRLYLANVLLGSDKQEP